ncbi:MAG: LptA/OstA family protein [Gemmatimonadota bacterium]|jgi:lipopolysaccharide export system protein LptA|nr:LptA/OstA family protein [Gemmatimonadota bacterium]
MYRFLLALAVLVLLPAALAAQERECSFTTGGLAGLSPSEPGMIMIYDPFVFSCNDGVTLSATSGRISQITEEAFFEGDVFFQDSTTTLRAAQANYDARTAHLMASGRVRFEDRQAGSSLTGPDLEYFRATETRLIPRMIATGRPTLLLYPDSASRSASNPIQLVGDLVEMEGQSNLTATGDVVITRTDLDARGDEVRYNTGDEELELLRNAVIRSENRELAGERILARLSGGTIEYVHSTSSARMESEDLNVTGEDLQIFFVGEKISRAVTIGAPEADPPVIAMVTARNFELVADSLDARFTDQRLEQVVAIGNARGTTTDTTAAVPVDSVRTVGGTGTPAAVADSAALATGSVASDSAAYRVAAAFASDWVRGDTIIGYFAPVPEDSAPADSIPPTGTRDGTRGENVQLERIVTIGNAQSVYRLSGTTGLAGTTASQGERSGLRTNLNFLVGERIELELADGEMKVARVEGLQYGLYLEPEAVAPTPDTPETSPDASPDTAPEPRSGATTSGPGSLLSAPRTSAMDVSMVKAVNR